VGWNDFASRRVIMSVPGMHGFPMPQGKPRMAGTYSGHDANRTAGYVLSPVGENR
jgi:hypothetical protein